MGGVEPDSVSVELDGGAGESVVVTLRWGLADAREGEAVAAMAVALVRKAAAC